MLVGTARYVLSCEFSMISVVIQNQPQISFHTLVTIWTNDNNGSNCESNQENSTMGQVSEADCKKDSTDKFLLYLIL